MQILELVSVSPLLWFHSGDILTGALDVVISRWLVIWRPILLTNKFGHILAAWQPWKAATTLQLGFGIAIVVCEKINFLYIWPSLSLSQVLHWVYCDMEPYLLCSSQVSYRTMFARESSLLYSQVCHRAKLTKEPSLLNSQFRYKAKFTIESSLL